jgi:short-subunit dehydrogenase
MTPSDKPLAVITGASSGIGLELAKQFASNAHDVLIAAEDAELMTAAAEIGALGAQVETVQVDLATHDGVEELAAAITRTGRPVAALALNAGRGAGGEFVGGTALEDELEIIDLNCRSTVHLAKRVLPGMVARGEGRVLITSSIASTMPGTYQAVYNASKSFTQAFALAIREELKDTGVTVTSLMPGPTDTEFFERADMLDTRIGAGHKDEAAQVAEQAFSGMMSGDERVEAGGLMSKMQGRFSRVLPDALKSKAHAKMAEPGSASEDDS